MKLRSPVRIQKTSTNLWRLPLLCSLFAVAVAILALHLDWRHAHDGMPYPTWLVYDGPDTIRTILATVASVSLTVVTVLISLAFVGLTVAATSLGPRHMQAILGDWLTQTTIGSFIATFVYSFIVLVRVRSGPQGLEPHLSTQIAVLAVFIDTGLLVAFLDNLARSIQPRHVFRRVVGQLDFAIRAHGQALALWDEPIPLSEGERAVAEIELPGEGVPVPALRTGYIQKIRHSRLIKAAARADAVIRFRRRPGHFVLAGETIAEIWWGTPVLARQVQQSLIIADFRTLQQDLELAIDQVVETGIRALSPAINDTFTGLMSIDWLGESVRKLAVEAAGTPLHRDPSGRVRVIDYPLAFASVVKAAFAKIRQSSNNNPAIVIRLFETFERLAPYLHLAEQKQAVVEELRATYESARNDSHVKADWEDIEASYRRAATALGVLADLPAAVAAVEPESG